MKFFDPKAGARAPVRVVVYLERELYEKAENASQILGYATLERLIIKLLRNVVEDLEKRADLRPFWERGEEVYGEG